MYEPAELISRFSMNLDYRDKEQITKTSENEEKRTKSPEKGGYWKVKI